MRPRIGWLDGRWGLELWGPFILSSLIISTYTWGVTCDFHHFRQIPDFTWYYVQAQAVCPGRTSRIYHQLQVTRIQRTSESYQVITGITLVVYRFIWIHIHARVCPEKDGPSDGWGIKKWRSCILLHRSLLLDHVWCPPTTHFRFCYLGHSVGEAKWS